MWLWGIPLLAILIVKASPRLARFDSSTPSSSSEDLLHASDFETSSESLSPRQKAIFHAELRRAAGRWGGVRGLPLDYNGNGDLRSSDINAASSSSNGYDFDSDDYEVTSDVVTFDDSVAKLNGNRNKESVERIMANVLREEHRLRKSRLARKLSQSSEKAASSPIIDSTEISGFSQFPSFPSGIDGSTETSEERSEFQFTLDTTTADSLIDRPKIYTANLGNTVSSDGFRATISYSRSPSTDRRTPKT